MRVQAQTATFSCFALSLFPDPGKTFGSNASSRLGSFPISAVRWYLNLVRPPR